MAAIEYRSHGVETTSFVMATECDTRSLAMYNSTFADEVWSVPYYEYWQFQLYLWIFKVGSPAILFLGLVGNTLSFVILQTRSMRTSATRFLLSALAVCDTGCLLTQVLNKWVSDITQSEIQMRKYNIHTCRAHTFLTFLFHHMSPVTVIFLTIQRVICVYVPLKAKIICSRDNIAKAWFANFIVFLTFNLVISFKVNLTHVENHEPMCYYADDIHRWFSVTDAVIQSYLPCTVILTGNILILVKVKYNRMKLFPSQAAAQQNLNATTASNAMTKMLVVVTTAFILLTAPFYIWINSGGYERLSSEEQQEQMNAVVWYAVVYHLLELNFSINFFLYCVFGQRFRRAMVDAMTCGKVSVTSGSGQTPAS